jgi:vacuolar-type H+-ATPase subunit E/Vma4
MEYLERVKLDEILETFKAIENLNSTLKQVLKKESKKGSALEKFIKTMRKITDLRQHEEQLNAFLSKYGLANIGPCAVIARYAFNSSVEEIGNKIVENYGDQFNETYTSDGENITVSNQSTFESILKKVKEEILQNLNAKNLPNNSFIHFILYDSIFDPAVFKKAQEIL